MFIYAAIYQLVKHFPDKDFDQTLIDRFNGEIEGMFDDCRDFIQTHYFTTTRNDTEFWRANKHDLQLSDSLKHKLETYKAGLIVCPPLTTNESSYYSSFEIEFRNFWTNSNYYCMFAGMDWLPDKSLPKLIYRPDALNKSKEIFAALKNRTTELKSKLPSTYEYLSMLHGTSHKKEEPATH